MLFINSSFSYSYDYWTFNIMHWPTTRSGKMAWAIGLYKSVSPFPLLRSLSGSSRMTKEWGNSDRDPLKLNLNVWLSRLLSLEKLFLLGGGAIPRPFSLAWGDIRRSVRLSTNSVAASICSVMMCRSCILVSAAEYLINFSLCVHATRLAEENFTKTYHKFSC